ncbi:MAG: hypothetical protein IJE43_01550 [Alphaproteobacteria bacterium]|nr:hypothetical protein [Alphaproteobacteria bacterium]MBQ3234595.1 hypothetical protein [Clostridia bacterium]
MKQLTKILSLIIAVITIFTFVGCDKGSDGDNLNSFYTKTVESQALLDDLADDIYSNWYDAIYDDDFGGNINLAIAAAFATHDENVNTIEANDAVIQDLYKSVRDGDQSDIVKEVLHAYTDYYEFVMNVSGSFNSYSAGKETKKKALATALKNLSYEI